MKRPKTTQGWTQFSTVIGVAGGLIMLFVAVIGISSTETTVNELQNLVNTSAQQLEILINQSNTQREQLSIENQAVMELAHQTTIQAYSFEKSHRVDISSCYYYPADEKIEFQLDVMYNTDPTNPSSNWLPSTITFEVETHIYASLAEKETKEQLYSQYNPTLPHQFISPSKENEWQYFLTDIFEDVNNIKNVNNKNIELFVRTEYELTPYSIAKKFPFFIPSKKKGNCC